MKKIVQKEAPVLREIAKEVPLADITSPKIQNIIREMRVALDSQDDGVAIAAPQIGYALRIFVVSQKVRSLMRRKKVTPEEEAEELQYTHTIYINPMIKKLSQEKRMVEEGCLSVRYLYGKVNRSTKATVIAYDEHGKKFTKGATGLLAQIFQHEIDHLDGILFIDKAKYVEEMPPATLSNADITHN